MSSRNNQLSMVYINTVCSYAAKNTIIGTSENLSMIFLRTIGALETDEAHLFWYGMCGCTDYNEQHLYNSRIWAVYISSRNNQLSMSYINTVWSYRYFRKSFNWISLFEQCLRICNWLGTFWVETKLMLILITTSDTDVCIHDRRIPDMYIHCWKKDHASYFFPFFEHNLSCTGSIGYHSHTFAECSVWWWYILSFDFAIFSNSVSSRDNTEMEISRCCVIYRRCKCWRLPF